MRRSRLLSAALIAAAALSACGRGGGGHASIPTGPQHALNAGGEPEWSAQVRDGMLHFTAGEASASTLKASFADHGRDGLVWQGTIPSGPVRLTVLSKPCQDADTGMTYPLSAVLQAPGTRYAGCAAPPGQGLGPRS